MELYPAFLSLSGRRVLVYGSGTEALRRATNLVGSGALVTLIDPQAPSDIPGISQVHRREFQPHDLNDCWLAVCASENKAANSEIALLCEERKIFCSDLTDSSQSGFHIPAVIDRSPLKIAISTGGIAPVLARVVKSNLEGLLPVAYSRLATIIGHYQIAIQKKIPDRTQRGQFWHQLISGPVAELGFDLNEKRIETTLRNTSDSNSSNSNFATGGFVSLVGAGPGDPDLLTFKALRLIRGADVLVYDRLVSPAILKLCRDSTELIYAGKAKANHTLVQNSINQLLVDLAKKGKAVVRLKGGDPFIFGRGGEEIETLVQHQLPFQVVPGITAASGCAAFSGIPLTHRDHAQSCVFVTGHLQNGQANLNWEHLIDPAQTIVVYMGLTALKHICETLIEHGRDAATPAALIERGTTPEQRVHIGSLQTLPEIIKAEDVRAPTLLIIGSVVTLRSKLRWFESIADTATQIE